MTNSSKEPKGYSEWIEEGKRLGFHDYWKEMTQLAVEEKDEIDGKPILCEWCKESNLSCRKCGADNFITSLHHSHTEELEQAREEERRRVLRAVAVLPHAHIFEGAPAPKLLSYADVMKALTPPQRDKPEGV